MFLAALPAPFPLLRSAPLPIKVDGFSMGAVIGFSEQQTLVCFATNSDVDSFKAVGVGVEEGMREKGQGS